VSILNQQRLAVKQNFGQHIMGLEQTHAFFKWPEQDASPTVKRVLTNHAGRAKNGYN
jgi:hypothetical protein